MKRDQYGRIAVSALTVAVIALVMFLLGAAALGDVLTLKSGQVLEGKVTQSGDQVMLTTPNATIVYTKDEVASISVGPTAAETYAQRASELKDNDAEGHYQLGLFAESKGLLKSAAQEYGKAIAADPNHAGARAKLGYTLDNGAWVTRDEMMARKGMVAYKGRYVTAEEAEKLKAADTEFARSQDEYRLVGILADTIKRSSGQQRTDAEDKLAGISGARSLDALVTASRDGDAAVRMAAVRAFQNYKEDKAAFAILDSAVNDPVGDIREKARSILAGKQNKGAFDQALRLVASDDETTRSRAGEVLAALGDVAAIPYLIDNLSWTRTPPPAPAPQASPPGTRTAAGRQYVSGYRAVVAPHSAAVEPIISRIDENGRHVLDNPQPTQTGAWQDYPQAAAPEMIQNRGALSALQALTGQDFGFDGDAWRQWYSANSRRLKARAGAVAPGN
jgi:hypothetical protein